MTNTSKSTANKQPSEKPRRQVPSYQDDPPVVCRLDALEFYIEQSPENADRLHAKPDLLLDAIMASTVADIRPDEIEYYNAGPWHSDVDPKTLKKWREHQRKFIHFTSQPPKDDDDLSWPWSWKLHTRLYTADVDVSGYSNSLGEVTIPEGGLYGPLRPDLKPHLFRKSMSGAAPPLGKILITNTKKLYFTLYIKEVEMILRRLSLAGISLIPKKLEPALDTLSKEKGHLLMMTQMPVRFNPRMLYHFRDDYRSETGRLIPIPGPSPDGLDEYHGYRPKRRGDKRPSSERTQGGHRVCHAYKKLIEIETRSEILQTEIYRTECQLWWAACKNIMKRHGFSDPHTFLRGLDVLVPEIFRFRELDPKIVEKYILQYPSTRGQVYELITEHGFTMSDITRSRWLRVPENIPEIIVYQPEPMMREMWLHTFPASFGFYGVDLKTGKSRRLMSEYFQEEECEGTGDEDYFRALFMDMRNPGPEETTGNGN